MCEQHDGPNHGGHGQHQEQKHSSLLMGQSNKRRQPLICINGTVYRGFQRRRKMYT